MICTRKKSAAARIGVVLLAICCAFCAVAQPIQVHALATEVIIGGVISAFFAACGIVLTIDQLTGSDVGTYLYDQFTAFCAEKGQQISDLIDVSQLLMYNGMIKIKQSISNTLTEFTDWFVSDNDITVSTPVLNTKTDVITATNGNDYKVHLLSAGEPYPDIEYLRNHVQDFIADIPGNTVLPVDIVYKGKRYSSFKYYASNIGWVYLNPSSDNTPVAPVDTRSANRYLNSFALYYTPSSHHLRIYGGLTNPGSVYVVYIDLDDVTLGYVSSGGLLTATADPVYPDVGQDDNLYLRLDGVETIPTTVDDFAEQSLGRTETNTNVVSSTVAASDADVVIPDAPPSVGDYDLAELGDLLTTRFPFSIPWDVKKMLDMLHADPVPPTWTVKPLDIEMMPDTIRDAEITVDLSDDVYDGIMSIVRWGIVVLYCAGLAVATKHLIWS